MTESSRKTSEERRELLARQVTSLITQGRRVESQSDFQAVLVQGHRVNHVLHLGSSRPIEMMMVYYCGESPPVPQAGEVYDSNTSSLRLIKSRLGTLAAPPAWGSGQSGAAGSGQPPLSERGVLDSAHRGPLAGPAAGLRGLEEYPSPLLPLAGPGCVGPSPRRGHR